MKSLYRYIQKFAVNILEQKIKDLSEDLKDLTTLMDEKQRTIIVQPKPFSLKELQEDIDSLKNEIKETEEIVKKYKRR